MDKVNSNDAGEIELPGEDGTRDLDEVRMDAEDVAGEIETDDEAGENEIDLEGLGIIP